MATSSGEAGLIAMYDGATRGLGIQTVMAEMAVAAAEDDPHHDGLIGCEVFCGDQGLGKMRHLEVKFLWSQEIVQMGRMRVEKVSAPLTLRTL